MHAGSLCCSQSFLQQFEAQLILRCCAMQEEESGEEGTIWHRSERSRMWARRSVRLPETARLDAIKAKYHDGVLTVAVPKDEKKLESRAIDIE